jgi:DNA-binding transcriptional MerR regulator
VGSIISAHHAGACPADVVRLLNELAAPQQGAGPAPLQPQPPAEVASQIAALQQQQQQQHQQQQQQQQPQGPSGEAGQVSRDLQAAMVAALAAIAAALPGAITDVLRCQALILAAAGAYLAARIESDAGLKWLLEAPTEADRSLILSQLGVLWLGRQWLARTPIGLFRAAGGSCHPLGKERGPLLQLAAFPGSKLCCITSGTTRGVIADQLHRLFLAGAAHDGGGSGGDDATSSVAAAGAVLEAMFSASAALDSAMHRMQWARNESASLHGYDSRGASAVLGQFGLTCLVCGDDALIRRLTQWLGELEQQQQQQQQEQQQQQQQQQQQRQQGSRLLDPAVMASTAVAWGFPAPREGVTAARAVGDARDHALVQLARKTVQNLAASGLPYSTQFRAALALVRALAARLRGHKDTNYLMIGLLVAGSSMAGERDQVGIRGSRGRGLGQGVCYEPRAGLLRRAALKT